ncbi:MAG: NUDIX domain-containing protein [Burkholderiales bacterium]|nr:NUDIX domain-containing protein [Anaerolineae bacterium]
MPIERQSVIIVLEDAAGRVALQLRDDKPNITDPNQWGLFGGWMELTEQPAAAGIREIHEELGITIDGARLEYIGIQVMHPNSQTFVYRFRVNGELDNAVLSEGQTWRFVAADEIALLAPPMARRHLDVLEWYWEQI